MAQEQVRLQRNRQKIYTDEEVVQLIVRYKRTRDQRLAETICNHYTNLVESVARKYAGPSESLEDLIQEGFLGLLNAIEPFEPGRNVKFPTYATYFIAGHIKHYLRDKGKIIKEPAWLQELAQRATRAVEVLTARLKRTPLTPEIAVELGCEISQVEELMASRDIFRVTSLSQETDDDSGPLQVEEKIADPSTERQEIGFEDKAVLEDALLRLKPLEQVVLRHFFYEDLSQTEISHKLDISCNYVSHLLRGGIQKLRKVITNAELIESQVRIRELQRRFNSYKAAVENYTAVDQLTGLYNCKYFNDRLAEEVSRAYRAKDDLSILLIDISYAKHPHQPVHDEVIIDTASLVRDNIRTVDIPARLDRSRFAVILPDTGISAFAPLARLTNILQTTLHGDKPLAISTAAAHYPKDGSSAKELLTTAEAALSLHRRTQAPAA